MTFGEDCQRPATGKRSTVMADPQVVNMHRMGLAIGQYIHFPSALQATTMIARLDTT
jgi:hypothetical protein